MTRSYWGTGANDYVESTVAYDSYGRPTTVTDGAGKTTTTGYHSFYGYAETITNALNHVVTTVMDPGFGVPTAITDANNKVTTLAYDDFGRLEKVWLPTEPTSGAASLEFEYHPEARPAWVKSRTLQTTTPSAQYLENWSYVDGFGRDLQSQSASSNSGKRLLSSTGYNDVGQVEYTVAPYEENGVAGSDYLTPTWSSLVGVHQFSYDALGRATKDEMQSNGTALWHTATTYDGWEQTVTDANGHATDYSYDAFGQLTTVTEQNDEGSGAVSYTTGYQYNLLGNLTQVTDHASNVTTMSYDLLGRKSGMTDPDMGAWSYNYNDVGNLTSQQDGNNNWIYLEYDDLHRLTGKRKDSASGTYLSQYDYDPSGYKGQLHKTRSYDAVGTLQVETEVAQIDDRYRPLQTKWHIFGGQHIFTMATSYNAADQVVTTTYPADNTGALGEVVTHSYNSIGQLNQVVSDDSTQFVSRRATTRVVN